MGYAYARQGTPTGTKGHRQVSQAADAATKVIDLDEDWEDAVTGATVVEDEWIQDKRWSSVFCTVYRFSDASHLAVEHDRPATEMQEDQGLTHLDAYVVVPTEVTVTRYLPPEKAKASTAP